MQIYTRKLLLFFTLLFASLGANALTASFTADVTAGCSPLVVHFTNASTGATSYYWDLGNGTNSTLTNVSGSYITPGTYTCVLTAYNGSSSSTYSITITVYPSPTVSFHASDTIVCLGSATTFTNTSSAGVSGAVTLLWNFGDGSTSTATSPTHTYAAIGTYNVTLIVTNSMGCSTTLTLTAYIHVFGPPTAGFSAGTTYLCHIPATFYFTNSTSGYGPYTCAWSFGDGGTSSATSPSHGYGSSGSYTVKLVVTDVHGCVDSITRPSYVTVGTILAAFTRVDTACANTTVTFYNTSSPHISSDWNFGDGGTATTDTGTHYYTTPGTYSVRLVIYNGSCYDTVFHSIYIRAPLGSTFTFSPTAPCPAPSTITFTGSVVPGSTVAWTFGDGGTSTALSPGHTYTANGTYVVYMMVTDIHGCIKANVQTVVIHDLIMHTTASPIRGCAPLVVNFSGSLSTTIPTPGAYPYGVSSYSWTFGDGGSATSATPAHTYTAAGTYTVIRSVTTANGCTAFDTLTILVGTPPHVTFTSSATHVCYGVPITFTAHGDSADTYYWSFGDGSGTAPDTTGTETHYFTHPGVFTITLVGSFNGCMGTPYTWVDSIIIDSPKAQMTTNYFCSSITAVKFFDWSIGDDSHLWMFGDGTTSTLDSVIHTYATTGIYTCSLATYNSRSGCRDTTWATVDLTPTYIHMFADDTVLCVGDAVNFSFTDSGAAPASVRFYTNGALAYSFYAPGATGTFADTFNIRGLYTVKMVTTNQHGCNDTQTHTNWIKVAGPIDTFTAAPVSGCSPVTVTFTDHTTDISGATLTSYQWNFGDGGTASVSTPTVVHTYTAGGSYTVIEMVTDNYGCKDTSVRPALINVWKPLASFAATNLYPCPGNPITFNNYSTGIASSFWMFGDGTTSTATSPTHAYTASGAYTVKLVVTDSHGCTDTVSYPSYINVNGPHASFYMNDSFSICPPLTVHFTNTSTAATSYSWSFGDGGTSVATNPSDYYVAVGLYTVMLIATNTHGCKDTAYGHVTLYGYAGGFTYAPLTGCAPLLVHFSATLSNVPNIIWDFADGTTTTASYMDTASHYYTHPGAYIPKLILSDNTGCQNSSVGIDTIKVDGITPGFTTNPHPICVNTNIFYVDTSHSYFSTITTWHWLFTAGDTSNISSPAYNYTATGTYPVILTVTDGWGCTGTVTENIPVYPPPTISTSPDTVICLSDSAWLHGYGGVSYSWLPTTTLGCPTCQTTTANPTVVTTYTVTGIDANGCVNTDSVTVRLRTATVSRGWGDTAVCRNIGVQLFDTGGTKYTWIPATGLNNAHISNPIATPPDSTTYMIIAQYGSCVPDTNYVTVIVHQLPTVNAGPDQTLYVGQLAYIHATGSLITSYMWQPAATLSCDSCADPIGSMIHTTTYVITVTSDFGCKASDSVTIFMSCNVGQLFIPNTFTPNGDGENDVFYPRGSGVSIIKSFRIYNRWGNLLFEHMNFQINDINSAWDGSYNGSSPRPDVYVYVIDAVCATGEPIFIKGDVTIVK